MIRLLRNRGLIKPSGAVIVAELTAEVLGCDIFQSLLHFVVRGISIKRGRGAKQADVGTCARTLVGPRYVALDDAIRRGLRQRTRTA